MVVDATYLNDLRRTLDSYSVLQGTPIPPDIPMRYRNYIKRIRMVNARFNQSVAKSLVGYDFPEVALVVTGSNGRLEGDPSSPVEYIIVGRLPEGVQSIPKLEVKDIERSCLSCYQNDPKKVFPGRVLDGVAIGGDQNYLAAAKMLVSNEIKDPKLKHRIGKRRIEYRQITQRGHQSFNGELIRHFDLDKGFAYYTTDKTEHNGNGKPASFKYGPLRFVQFKVLEELYDISSRGQAVLELPANTSDRLRWLRDNRLLKLTSSQVDEVIDAYEYFLWLYHISQYRYREMGESRIKIDREDVEEERDVLLSLLSMA